MFRAIPLYAFCSTGCLPNSPSGWPIVLHHFFLFPIVFTLMSSLLSLPLTYLYISFFFLSFTHRIIRVILLLFFDHPVVPKSYVHFPLFIISLSVTFLHSCPTFCRLFFFFFATCLTSALLYNRSVCSPLTFSLLPSVCLFPLLPSLIPFVFLLI